MPPDAPTPDRSAAPRSTSRMLRLKITCVQNGIDINSVGISDTLATNQIWMRNSRQANGGLNLRRRVSGLSEKTPPIARTGLVITPLTPLETVPRVIKAGL